MGKITKAPDTSGIDESQTLEDYKLAIKVSDRIELENVRLISCSCEHKRFTGSGEKSFVINKSTESHLEKETSRIYVLPKFKLETFEEGAKSKEPFAVIEAGFLLVYKAKGYEGLTEGCVEQFGRINGIYNAWPYWREFVQNTLVRMSLPSLTIPVFRLFPPKKEAATEKKTAVLEPPKKTKKKAKKKAKKKVAVS